MIHKYLNPAILLGVFLVCELVVNPLGEFPLNDGCTYAKSVKILVEEGRLHAVDWQATVITHILWGSLFVKIFGWSFFVIRMSTLIMSLTGVLLLYAIAKKICRSSTAAMAAALTLLFNPYYFNLSHVFMTDVSFVTLLLACVYVIFRYRESANPLWAFALLILAVALIHVRQYGIIVPAAFVIISLIDGKNRRRNALVSATVFLFCCLTLWLYEVYLSTQMQTSTSYRYVFRSGEDDPVLQWDISGRVPEMLVQLLMYTSPVAILLWFGQMKLLKKWVMLLILLLSGLFFVKFLKPVWPLPGNILTDMGLGPDTFYENINARITKQADHTSSEVFVKVMLFAQTVLCVFSLFSFLAWLVLLFRQRNPSAGERTVPAILLLMYAALLTLTPGDFDRYYLPLIALTIPLLLSPAGPRQAPASILILVLMAYVSVAGTKDYLAMNRARWKAYSELKEVSGVPAGAINAGFEPKCWDASGFSWLYDANILDGHEYLIQYSGEDGFERIGSYPFKRFFPPQSDTVFVFRRLK